jgi:hypothetical protein
MRYVEWAGVRWTVQDVEVQRPRLLLRLGEVYNGKSPGPSDALEDLMVRKIRMYILSRRQTSK